MQYQITLTQQEAQVVILALGELPMKSVLGLFNKLQQSFADQEKKLAKTQGQSYDTSSSPDIDLHDAIAGS
jgi:hypothetical protein